ncbi:hypothetical protein KPH14_004147 [Odynerus spinipes]|uniref:Uncharacterized protein n=1 Tax=Odynerus spinipes TaxID=1348599 RepID=A0AAD9RY44_9HYME|nr:hypothetical protein KPH14_004147 [Odynerus spinipes]
MARLLCTIWALILNSLGVSIFKTCFANPMEDDYGEPLTTGPPITSFLFAAGIYAIVVRSTLFPQSFRKPNRIFLCLYEILQDQGYNEAAETFVNNKSSMAAFSYGIATTFFLLALHVTKTVDYTILADCGLTYFGSHLKSKLWYQIQSELPKPKQTKKCPCKPRRKDRSKSRAKDCKS